MVSANPIFQGESQFVNPENKVFFYEKFSGFRVVNEHKVVSKDKQRGHDGAPRNYPYILE